jgi:hypothetical protein
MLNQPNGCPSATNWWEFWCCGPGTILLPQSAQLWGKVNPRVSRLGWEQKVLGDWTSPALSSFFPGSKTMGIHLASRFCGTLAQRQMEKNTLV